MVAVQTHHRRILPVKRRPDPYVSAIDSAICRRHPTHSVLQLTKIYLHLLGHTQEEVSVS